MFRVRNIKSIQIDSSKLLSFNLQYKKFQDVDENINYEEDYYNWCWFGFDKTNHEIIMIDDLKEREKKNTERNSFTWFIQYEQILAYPPINGRVQFYLSFVTYPYNDDFDYKIDNVPRLVKHCRNQPLFIYRLRWKLPIADYISELYSNEQMETHTFVLV